MAYLPNSIERTAPLLGFDPYAYIMDQPSNLKINKMRSPYDTDYFAKSPEEANRNKGGAQPEGKQECQKKSNQVWAAIGKGAIGLGALGLGIFGIKKGITAHKAKKAAESATKTGIIDKIKNLFKKVPKEAAEGAAEGAKEAAKGATEGAETAAKTGFFAKIKNMFKKAPENVAEAAKDGTKAAKGAKNGAKKAVEGAAEGAKKVAKKGKIGKGGKIAIAVAAVGAGLFAIKTIVTGIAKRKAQKMAEMQYLQGLQYADNGQMPGALQNNAIQTPDGDTLQLSKMQQNDMQGGMSQGAEAMAQNPLDMAQGGQTPRQIATANVQKPDLGGMNAVPNQETQSTASNPMNAMPDMQTRAGVQGMQMNAQAPQPQGAPQTAQQQGTQPKINISPDNKFYTP